jgi:hypothetical protein
VRYTCGIDEDQPKGQKQINCFKSNGKEAHDLKVVVVVT